MKYKDFYKELLEEAKYERYVPILTGGYSQGSFENEVNIGHVKGAVSNLRRDDAIQWYLRWHRYLNWRKEENAHRNQKREYPAAKIKWLRDFEKKTGVLNKPENSYGSSIYGTLDLANVSHFLSLPIEKIQNFRFLYQDPREVDSLFRQYEMEWTESHGEEEQWIDMTEELESGEIEMVYQFPDKFAWFNLKRPYCDKEGAAMGHCGNKYYNKKESHTILSLRKLEKRKDKTFGRPSLTFIVDNITGNLGESKGRANEKPDEKYHPYILKLLTLKNDSGKFIINKIVGGGYAAESNFKISDLNETDQKSLFSIRKDLKPLVKTYEDEGITDELIENVKRSIGPKYSTDLFNINGKNFKIFAFKNVMEMYDVLEAKGKVPKKLESYKEYISGESSMDYDFVAPSKHDDADYLRFFNKVKRDPRFNKNEIEEYIKDKYDIDENSDWIDVLIENEDELIDQVESAIYQGEVSGIKSQVYSSWYEGMVDLNIHIELSSGEIISFYFVYEHPENKWNSKISMIIEIKDLLALLDDGEVSDLDKLFDLEFDVEGDMNAPYHGFDGYDENAAVDYFFENLDIK